jgi:hypothetical protein
MVRIHPDPPTDARPGIEGFPPHGAIAQLGERLLCKQEVTGSIPVGSTRIAWEKVQNAARRKHPSQCILVLFGCSLTIRKKQGGSGCSNGRIHLGKKLHCSIEAAA